ncbi:MAG TPA: ABC transporter permease subunit, partial [Solirubrobacterales bacterium]|nr:ABC transporter permease subunit [Solirubrobacterales bacterium]
MSQVWALTATHLSDRRRSVWAWGLPLGLMSAFIVAIFPSVEESISQAVEGYPEGLKEAFGIGQLSNVEQYLHAEMLSLIVPLALGYLAVRAIASGLTGAAETGRLDVLLSAPVSRTRLVAAGFLATA